MWVDPLGLYTYNMMPGIEGFQKYHFIPQQLKDHALIRASGMNIHDSKNIIYLPKNGANHPIRSIHLGSHSDYIRNIRPQINDIYNMGQSNNWSERDYKKATENLIKKERSMLRHGETRLRKIYKK